MAVNPILNVKLAVCYHFIVLNLLKHWQLGDEVVVNVADVWALRNTLAAML